MGAGSSERPGRGWWLRWVAANAIGLAIGQAAFAVVDDTIGEMGDAGDAVAHLGGLPVAGVIFGLSQWLAIRRYVPGAAWAIPAAAVGLTVGYIGGFLLGGGGVDSVFGFFLMGTATGLVQWLVMRRTYEGSGWWAAASAVGFLLGALVALGVAIAGLAAALPAGIAGFVLLLVFFGLVDGAIGGALTGAVFVGLKATRIT
jgi:hypothetical protein